MIDIKALREDPNRFQESAKAKNKDLDIQHILKLDEQMRSLKQEIEALAAEKNAASRGIAAADGEERSALIAEMKEVDEKESAKKKELEPIEQEFTELLLKIPNVLHEDVPVGKDESENVVAKEIGTPREFSFKVKDHLEIGEALDIIDMETAANVAGARFAYLKGDAVRLQFAMVQFVFETLSDEKILKKIAKDAGVSCSTKPFTPVLPPLMMRADVMHKMARLDEENAEERYHLPKDDMYLIGSAEHTLGPLHMKETLPEADLPIRYIGYSPAFRREAGSYGKDTRGIIRVHQFDKLEMETFSTPETSLDEQNFIVAIQEYLVSKLELPYQLIQICSGDTGTPDARQIDINTWIPSQKTYRETHTSDLMTDYQSRRLGTKVKRKDGSTDFVHMNDATAIAIGRMMVAILENNQQEDGSVHIPSVLQPYMGGKERIEPRS